MILESEGGRIAINPDRFDKLITALRTAVDNDGTLDKEATSYNDIFDAFRLALKFYHYEELDNQSGWAKTKGFFQLNHVCASIFFIQVNISNSYYYKIIIFSAPSAIFSMFSLVASGPKWGKVIPIFMNRLILNWHYY